jgi:type II secretory pathway component PulF
MPLFRYEAQDKTGRLVVGAMQVADETALQRRLTAMGYVPVIVHPAPDAVLPQGRAAGCDQPVPSWALALLYEELYTTVRAGIPLSQSLAATAERLPHRGLRTAVADLGRGVEAGAPLGKVLLRYPMMFRAGDRGLLAAGEQGGFIDRALRLLADRHEADHQIYRRTRLWGWYLAVLLFVAAFLTFPIVSFVKAAFAPELTDAPTAAAHLVPGFRAFAHTVLTVSLPVALVVGALGLWCRSLAVAPARRRRWHAALLRLPGLSGLAWTRAREQFARALQLLYHSGVAPGPAWAAAAGAVPNEELAVRLAAESRFVEGGGRFSEAMRRSGVFRESEAGMVATGESAGSVEEMLAKVADYSAMEVESAVHRLPFIARLAFYAVGGLVTVIAAGLAWKAFYMAIFRAFE